MKKMIFSFAAVMILLSGCDGVNSDIDDLPRTLRISVRTIADTENPYDGLTESDYQIVSTGAGNNDASSSVGTVIVTSGIKDDYARSDSVTVQATDSGSHVFAFWLLPSRTDSGSDPSSTEGNIRYDVASGGVDVSLRTDYAESEIVGVFAKDGSVAFTIPLTLDNASVDSNTTRFYFDLVAAADKTISKPMYRIFDDLGEARTAWLEFDSTNSSSNDSIDVSGSNVYSKQLSGILNPGVLDDWTVVVLYKDPADSDNVYVVK